MDILNSLSYKIEFSYYPAHNIEDSKKMGLHDDKTTLEVVNLNYKYSGLSYVPDKDICKT